jgi:Domain of unknown function (DUF4118)
MAQIRRKLEPEPAQPRYFITRPAWATASNRSRKQARMSHDNGWTAIDGEGIAWGAGAFAASVLAGVIIEPYRRTIGLENVTIIYLLIVVVAAAYGGRAAGLLAALSAALSYDFFLTTPYHQLVIDSLAQVVTVALLFGSGIVASLAGRARRRSTSQARQQTDALRLLNAITQTVAAGATGDADPTAAEGLYHLLTADRVTIKRTGPTGEAVVAEVGRTDEPLDTQDLPHLDPRGRLPRGFGRHGHPAAPRSTSSAVTTESASWLWSWIRAGPCLQQPGSRSRPSHTRSPQQRPIAPRMQTGNGRWRDDWQLEAAEFVGAVPFQHEADRRGPHHGPFRRELRLLAA